MRGRAGLQTDLKSPGFGFTRSCFERNQLGSAHREETVLDELSTTPGPIADPYQIAYDGLRRDWTVRRNGSLEVVAREPTRTAAMRCAIALADGRALIIDVPDDGVQLYGPAAELLERVRERIQLGP
jgi:hypothetical protein